MPSVTLIIRKLTAVRAELLRVSDAVSARNWLMRPEQDAWSSGEVIAHLSMVERAITSGADRVLQHPPRPVPLVKRIHLPISLAAWRGIRRKTPIPLDSSLLVEKESMLAALREVRQNTLAFLSETADRNLSAYRWPHPFFGSLNLYQWFRMIAHHEIRHTKQIREIVESLQK
jgi:hypothetical protein